MLNIVIRLGPLSDRVYGFIRRERDTTELSFYLQNLAKEGHVRTGKVVALFKPGRRILIKTGFYLVLSCNFSLLLNIFHALFSDLIELPVCVLWRLIELPK